MDADRTDLSVLLTNVLSLLLQVSIVPRTNATLGFAQYTTTDKKLYSDVEVTFYHNTLGCFLPFRFSKVSQSNVVLSKSIIIIILNFITRPMCAIYQTYSNISLAPIEQLHISMTWLIVMFES